MLGISPGLEFMGGMRWDLALYLVIIWIGVYLSTFRGIKWSAKVLTYFSDLSLYKYKVNFLTISEKIFSEKCSFYQN